MRIRLRAPTTWAAISAVVKQLSFPERRSNTRIAELKGCVRQQRETMRALREDVRRMRTLLRRAPK
jgi:hypothetical protein